MIIKNEPPKKDKDTDDQPGITLAGRFIPYTWLIGAGGAIVMIILFIGVMGLTGEDEGDASAEPQTEEVEDVEDVDVEDVEDVENVEDVEDAGGADRMWDNYINDESDGESDGESSNEEPADDDVSADEPDTTEETAEEPSVDAVSNDEMVETIKSFLTGYQIYGPGDTAQDTFDRIYPYVTESLANELVPNRGSSEAAPSIDVTHELIDIQVDGREGVENEYVATIVYTSEAMGEIYEHTDVYSIATDGARVSSATIRSATWK